MLCYDFYSSQEADDRYGKTERQGFDMELENPMTRLIPNEDLLRIIQESVPGKQITMAHIVASPDPILYQKLGLDPKIDYHNAAIGIMAITPYETAIIAADICMKQSAVKLGFIDRFSGTLIVTGLISDVKVGFEQVLSYTAREMDFTVCKITMT